MDHKVDIVKKIFDFLKNMFGSGGIKTGDVSGSPNIIYINNSKIDKLIVIPYRNVANKDELDQIIKEEFSPESEDHHMLFVREDSINHLMPYLSSPLTDKQKEIVKEWKRYLNKKYVGALVMSYRIINLEDTLSKYCDMPQNEEKLRLENMIRESRQKLYQQGYEYRRKIYNFARSGYIEGHFGAILGQLLAMDVISAPEKFRKIFEEALDYFEPAIWVDYDMNEYELLQELRRRLKQERPVSITIYTRGENRTNWVESFILLQFEKYINKKLDFPILLQSKNTYRIGCTPAASFTVTNSMIKLD